MGTCPYVVAEMVKRKQGQGGWEEAQGKLDGDRVPGIL